MTVIVALLTGVVPPSPIPEIVIVSLATYPFPGLPTDARYELPDLDTVKTALTPDPLVEACSRPGYD
jgi:hypothetical protein